MAKEQKGMKSIYNIKRLAIVFLGLGILLGSSQIQVQAKENDKKYTITYMEDGVEYKNEGTSGDHRYTLGLIEAAEGDLCRISDYTGAHRNSEGGTYYYEIFTESGEQIPVLYAEGAMLYFMPAEDIVIHRSFLENTYPITINSEASMTLEQRVIYARNVREGKEGQLVTDVISDVVDVEDDEHNYGTLIINENVVAEYSGYNLYSHQYFVSLGSEVTLIVAPDEDGELGNVQTHLSDMLEWNENFTFIPKENFASGSFTFVVTEENCTTMDFSTRFKKKNTFNQATDSISSETENGSAGQGEEKETRATEENTIPLDNGELVRERAGANQVAAAVIVALAIGVGSVLLFLKRK